jgi:predicted HicB family RNase H-like nuclease
MTLGRLSVYINPQLHTDAKVYAAKTNKSLSSVVEQAIKEFLERHQTDK